MVRGLEDLFPKLQGSGYRITSPKSGDYNCVAWAAGDAQNWWWPAGDGKPSWPAGAPRAETLSAFQQAFASLGYVACADESAEPGFEKIALFAHPDGFPTHVARQLANGRWTSKLGELEDLEHHLHDLTGTEYGAVVLLLKRPLP